MEATIANFTYTKDDGERSDRKIVVLSKPNDSYFGVEVENGDLSSVAGVLDYLAEKEVLEQYLKAKYNLTDDNVRYRRFKANKITRLTEDKITI